MKRGKLRKKCLIPAVGIAVLVVALNVAAWNSTAFSDWYIANIFPLWVNTYGRLIGVFPISVGEWLIAAGLALAGLAVVLGLVWAVAGILSALLIVWGKLRSGSCAGRRSAGEEALEREAAVWESTDRESEERCKEAELEARRPGRQNRRSGLRMPEGFRRFTKRFYLSFAWILLCVCLVMTLNCFILYHASTFSEHYYGEDDGEYSLVDLIEIYNMAAEECNRLALLMERDESGMVLYPGSVGRDGGALDMADKARELMRQLGETYPQLDGYYPRPKAMFFSDFMCQQHMQGYYFPFSMEANYNDVMHILNIPSTMCHELAHLRGYIYEDEANFIAYLACVQSDEAFFQYAGYLSVLTYLNNDLYYAWRDNRDAYEEAVAALPPVAVDEQVWIDNIFVTDEEWERINGKAWIDTEVVDQAADAFIDTNLKVNGIADGRVSYSRVVRLLLQYYKTE